MIYFPVGGFVMEFNPNIECIEIETYIPENTVITGDY
jgi:hypothetical protein